MIYPLRRLIAPLLLVTLAACGAAPRADPQAAVTAPARAVTAVTAAPAATAPATAPSEPPTATLESTPIVPTKETPMPTSDSAGQGAAPGPSPMTRPTPNVERVPSAEPAAVTGEVPQALLAQIVADAARRAGVDVAQVSVTSGEFVEWPDGALGCPQPGASYLQVVTPGYRVQIQAGANGYDYRADDKGYFFLCERGR